MTILQLFTTVIRQIWDGMSNITVPLLNIPVTSLLLGLFISCVSIQILNPLLGIGASLFNGASESFRATYHSAVRNHRVRSARAKAVQADKNLRDVSRWV